MALPRFLSSIGLAAGLAAGAAMVAPFGSVAGRETRQTAQAPQAAPTAQETDRPTSTPYSGDLSIFEDPDRAERLHIDRVMDVLAIREGVVVADIGAGSGWFTVRAANRVGPKGRVFAVDINSRYLEYIADRAKKEGLGNVDTVLGAEDNPNLPASSVDAVLVMKTYHEIAKPVTLMTHLRMALRPKALVGIIDREGNGADHGVAAEVVTAEMRRAGFELVGTYDFVKSDRVDYLLVFRVT